MEELPSSNVDKLLQDLQSADAYIRKTAAEELGKLNISNDRVQNVLKTVAESDDNKYVRSAAAQSYLSLGGKEGIQQIQEKEAVAPPPAGISAPRKHSGCLTAFLAFAVVGNALLGLITWGMASSVSSSSQGILIFSGLLNIAGVGFAIAIYKWKKWGVYGYIAVIGITMMLNLGFGDVVSAVRGFIPIALLLYLIPASWGQMD